MSIVVRANGGLGNRMRVLAACLALRMRLGREVEVLWINNYELNCDFDNLFLPIEGVVVTHMAYIPKWNKIGLKLRANSIKKTYENYDIQFTDKEIVELYTGNKDLINRIENANTVYINTCEQFYGDKSFISLLLPVPAVLQEVRRRLAGINTETYYGVHIRRGDNETSKRESPTMAFIEKLKKLEKSNNNLYFYLSTDDKGEAQILHKVMGEKLYWFAAGQNRAKPADIENALVDLLMLSKSKHIIGSFWSSFSEVAAQYGRVSLEVIKKETQD